MQKKQNKTNEEKKQEIPPQSHIINWARKIYKLLTYSCVLKLR